MKSTPADGDLGTADEPERDNAGKPWRWMAAWAAAVLSAVLLMVLAMQWASREQLRSDAQRVALQYALFFAIVVPDLDRVFAGQGFSDAAWQQLRKLRKAGDVFRFKLFDAQGRLLLVSDDLDRESGHATQGKIGDHHGEANQTVTAIVLGGNPFIELKEGTSPNRPKLFSEAYVPVLVQGKVQGVVEVYVDQSSRADTIATAHWRVAVTAAGLLAALALLGALQWLERLRRQRAAEERVRYLAHHDVLSGTLNRTSFAEAVRHAAWRFAEGGPRFSVLCIDLDHFKDVNDGHGHAAGDEVLRQVGERLRALVRQGDQVARLGGDEFAILQTGVGSPDDVLTLAQRVVTSLAAPMNTASQTLHCGGSVGAAIFGVDAQSEDEVMQKADVALYHAKANGRGRFSFYNAELDAKLQARRELTEDLRSALARRELSLHYQPLFAADGEQLTGYEALLRWQHPQRGNVVPADFIPLAEEAGLIDEIGSWVLREACRTAAGWPQAVSIAVNLSAAQFRRGDLVAVVTDALSRAGLDPTRLELEITESLLMSNTDAVVQVLHALSAMGVRIAMDDFGTGYSSLAYLWRFPFDKVKIDRAFTQHLGQDAKVDLIVRSIVSLAHSLNVRVNAEGVETMAQRQALDGLGCDELQGYLLGRPMPVERLAHLQGGARVATTAPVRPLASEPVVV